jgi:hypothetical protein
VVSAVSKAETIESRFEALEAANAWLAESNDRLAAMLFVLNARFAETEARIGVESHLLGSDKRQAGHLSDGFFQCRRDALITHET